MAFEDVERADAGLLRSSSKDLLDWSRNEPIGRARPAGSSAKKCSTWAGRARPRSSILQLLPTSAMNEPRDRLGARPAGRSQGTRARAGARVRRLTPSRPSRMRLYRGLLGLDGDVDRPNSLDQQLKMPETWQRSSLLASTGLTAEERTLVEDSAALGTTFTQQGGDGPRPACEDAAGSSRVPRLDCARRCCRSRADLALAGARPARVLEGHRQARRPDQTMST